MATLKSLKDFKASGAIVSREPVKKHIEWTTIDPGTGDEVSYDADIFLIKPPAGMLEDIYNAENKQQISLAISKCLLLESDKGEKERLTYEDVYQLDPPLRMAIWDQLKVLAGFERKNSQPPTSSTANSPSTESAAPQ